jgi:UV DNA damage endonuclease
MRIGYPCINTSLNCTANRTMRLANVTSDGLRLKIKENLDCLNKIIDFNIENGILFFRIGSGLIPFASHPVCQIDWIKEFQNEFKAIGQKIKKHNMRISMHPDQFVVLNALNNEIVQRSCLEIEYHTQVLDVLGLDSTAKVQIHLGGVYGDKKKSKHRFKNNLKLLSLESLSRLVVENDDRSYSLQDCLQIGIPVLFDTLHHSCLNQGESLLEAIKLANNTWSSQDGCLMIDYSSQRPDSRIGRHIESIDEDDFRYFLQQLTVEADVMLEIKDKEKSALRALRIIKNKV